MFFPDKIHSIEETGHVLEVGPGSSPHPRSDVYLEFRYSSREEEQAQFGYTGSLKSNKPIVYYDGGRFPFQDKEFDYIICSHVLEHVNDVEFFLQELQRVASKGYLEFPTVYYDYLFNFDVHKNFLLWDGTHIRWDKKKNYGLDEFAVLQSIFREALEKEAISIVSELREVFVQGFEWSDRIAFKHVEKLDRLCLTDYLIPDKRYKPQPEAGAIAFRQKLKIKLKLMIDSYL
jgi:SAM-dependent methyltransferase